MNKEDLLMPINDVDDAIEFLNKMDLNVFSQDGEVFQVSDGRDFDFEFDKANLIRFARDERDTIANMEGSYIW